MSLIRLRQKRRQAASGAHQTGFLGPGWYCDLGEGEALVWHGPHIITPETLGLRGETEPGWWRDEAGWHFMPSPEWSEADRTASYFQMVTRFHDEERGLLQAFNSPELCEGPSAAERVTAVREGYATGATEKTLSILGSQHVDPKVRAGTKAGMLVFGMGLLISALQAARSHKLHKKELSALKRIHG